jgi:hypothetical protein
MNINGTKVVIEIKLFVFMPSRGKQHNYVVLTFMPHRTQHDHFTPAFRGLYFHCLSYMIMAELPILNEFHLPGWSRKMLN